MKAFRSIFKERRKEKRDEGKEDVRTRGAEGRKMMGARGGRREERTVGKVDTEIPLLEVGRQGRGYTHCSHCFFALFVCLFLPA